MLAFFFGNDANNSITAILFLSYVINIQLYCSSQATPGSNLVIENQEFAMFVGDFDPKVAHRSK